MEELLQRVKALAFSNKEKVVAYRRHLHMHPELSFNEVETQKFIEEKLKEIGVASLKRMGNTGVIALIEGNNAKKHTIALRADIDALPIIEKNETTYCSKNVGVMHACGHDVHTASLLGVASILQQLKSDFEGTVKLIFQPGEEKLPGGASILIKEGVLKNPDVVSILGQHVMPLLPVGKIGFRKGLYMASTDEIYVKVKGKGGHGAMPHLTIDPVLMASHIIISLQQMVSRKASPIVPSVLSFGKVIANGATNVIPDEVYMEGTFRTLDETWRTQAHELMKNMAEMTAKSMGGSCEFEIRKGYPFLKNDEALTSTAIAYAEEFVGKENVVDLDIWMAAEDFAYYSQELPACFYRLGTRNEQKGITSSVHTATFDIDEEALEIGSGLMAWIALRQLAQA
jgi:amidohydrolase